jgi:protein transport protein SEC61 subunit gamma-like protein
VLKLARKPTREEFLLISKISILGIALIGMLGFIIYVFLTELPKAL